VKVRSRACKTDVGITLGEVKIYERVKLKTEMITTTKEEPV
jgi:hypothetical protein